MSGATGTGILIKGKKYNTLFTSYFKVFYIHSDNWLWSQFVALESPFQRAISTIMRCMKVEELTDSWSLLNAAILGSCAAMRRCDRREVIASTLWHRYKPHNQVTHSVAQAPCLVLHCIAADHPPDICCALHTVLRTLICLPAHLPAPVLWRFGAGHFLLLDQWGTLYLGPAHPNRLGGLGTALGPLGPESPPPLCTRSPGPVPGGSSRRRCGGPGRLGGWGLGSWGRWGLVELVADGAGEHHLWIGRYYLPNIKCIPGTVNTVKLKCCNKTSRGIL